MARKTEVIGIDGKLFQRLKQQANHENLSVDVLIHRYLSFALLNPFEVRKSFYKSKEKEYRNNNYYPKN